MLKTGVFTKNIANRCFAIVCANRNQMTSTDDASSNDCIPMIPHFAFSAFNL